MNCNLKQSLAKEFTSELIKFYRILSYLIASIYIFKKIKEKVNEKGKKEN